MTARTTSLPQGCNPDCTGCRHRHLSVEESLAQKQSFAEKCFEPWKNVLRPIIAAQTQLQYRERVVLAAEYQGDRWSLGLRKRVPGTYETELVPIQDCPLHVTWIQTLLRELTHQLQGLSPTYPLAAISISGGHFTWVLKSRTLPRSLPASTNLLSSHGIRSIWINLNPNYGNRTFAQKGWNLVSGAPYLEDSHQSSYGPSSFQQQRTGLPQKAFFEAKDFLLSLKPDFVMDLYSGTGESLLCWAKLDIPCAGVELSGESIQGLKKINGQIPFYQGTVEQRLPQIQSHLDNKTQAVAYINPPRTGLGDTVINWINNSKKLTAFAYLSCSPASLARDLEKIVSRKKWKLESLQPYDFFPNTHHFEVLALVKEHQHDRSSAES